MDKNKIAETLKKVKESSKKRNFNQSYDLIINLKNLDLKKPEQQVDFFQTLHYTRKKIKICAFVGPELKEQAKANCDEVIIVDDFLKYKKDKKLIKKLANEYDFFIAQANIMPKVATSFGKTLGIRGKMPNPKAGCVVPPKSTLKPLCERLRKTIRVSVKKELSFKCSIGKEDTPDDQIIDNIQTIYNNLVHHLPSEENNIKSVQIKLTMDKPIKVE